jgi:sulfide:quinone oxidoreductase
LAGKTILILGGGTGGLVAAHRLRRMLGNEHRVVLVDRTPQYTFAPSYTWVMLGKRNAPHISRDLRSLTKKGIEFALGEVQSIDTANKHVVVGEQQMSFDYLIIALGAEYSSDEVPGLGRSWTFYHLDGAEGLSERLQTFRAGRLAVVASALPYRCPAALYEGALLLDDHFRRHGTRADIEISIFTPEAPLPIVAAGATTGERLVELVRARGINFTSGVELAEVDHRSRELRFKRGATAGCDLLIATPLHHCPRVLRQSGLAGESGWVEVDRETLATPFEDIYAIGDAIVIPLGDGKTLPKTAAFAHGQAEVVARNIAAEIAGREPIWAFGGQSGCFMSTETGKAAYIVGNFFAQPEPQVSMRGPNRRWHWAKLGFERVWLWRWF